MKEFESMVLNLIPYLGNGKMFVEGCLGHDLITHRKFAWWECALGVGLGGAGVVGDAGKLGLLDVACEDSRLAPELSEMADKAGDAKAKAIAEDVIKESVYAESIRYVREFVNKIKDKYNLSNIGLRVVSEDEFIMGIAKIKDIKISDSVLKRLDEGCEAIETQNGRASIIEAETASIIPEYLTDFNAEFGFTGQLDLQTKDYIIDACEGNGNSKKNLTFFKYFKQYGADKAAIVNPKDKDVILFGTKLG